MRWIPVETSFVATSFWEQGVSTVGLVGNYVVDLSASKSVDTFFSNVIPL